MSDRRDFPPVPGGYPFPQLELETLEKWEEQKVFEGTLDSRRGQEEFSFYEGPPTANNVPHVGHVVTRVMKDLYPRYRTMRGYHVPRKAGWDTHGLPVEIEVEKTLGFSGKEEIENYGIAKFNAACLESVGTYEVQWREMTERVAYWVDLDGAYKTYTNDYIESEWWALAELWHKDLLYEGHKIQPYCGRCGTSLSSHEVAQNYKDAEDPSIWVRFPLRADQKIAVQGAEPWPTSRRIDIVAWTTTPWTLLSHAGLAVHPEFTYVAVAHPTEPDVALLIADDLSKPVPFLKPIEGGKPERLDLRNAEVLGRFRGADLEGLLYDRPLPVEPTRESGDNELSDQNGFRVVLADYVTLSDGTGIVHTAPLFGEDDYQTGQKYGLPQFQAVDNRGCVDLAAGFDEIQGLWFKDADPIVLRRLRSEGRLLHDERYVHSYPFCWRCDQPLLYYATTSWFVRTTAQRDKLIEKNLEIQWHPAHVGKGRFGDWLENVVDWALSRSRYWGTPLPVWKCGDCETFEVIGSFEQLFERSGRERPADLYDRAAFDPHRPAIDEFTWDCASCSATMQRVPYVIDAWFDSGAMPFAQYHYPFENRELFERRFPADFISEAVDQTRGWFYTLHVLGCLLFDQPAYRNCIVLGHVNDEDGRKMSKRLGNVVEPMGVIEQTGVDALRWYFYINNPEVPSRFSARLVREAAQTYLLPLWNALSFFTIYANIDGWSPGNPLDLDPEERPALDRWILSRLDGLVAGVQASLDAYRTTEAARQIEVFLDELTNWYIRRSRDRFWAPEDAPEQERQLKLSAYDALYTVLTTLSKVVAPLTPFIAETLHQHLVCSQDPSALSSVHLEDWPQAKQERREEELEAAMAAVARVVKSGHSARNAHGVKTRQPLSRVTFVTNDDDLPGLIAPYESLVLDELNVRSIDWASDRSRYVRHSVTPDFRKCGPRFGKRMPLVKKALDAADGDELARLLADGRAVEIEIEGQLERLETDEVEVKMVNLGETIAHGDADLLVVLDVELNDELIAEGLAREVVHRIQTRRKSMDLDYADRITIEVAAESPLRDAIESHREWIMSETLTDELSYVSDPSDLESAPIEDQAFSLAVRAN